MFQGIKPRRFVGQKNETFFDFHHGFFHSHWLTIVGGHGLKKVWELILHLRVDVFFRQNLQQGYPVGSLLDNNVIDVMAFYGLYDIPQ